ncbi:MAG TPA: hypothetical protein VFT39_22415 [Vicinamibacterales bacterium]|nr:hypothetical protein [Vicinamibacterales bacterium]
MLMTNHRSDGPTGGIGVVRDAVITIIALLLVFAAFDDITTDNATTFSVEYSALAICAAWLAFVSVRLWRTHHRILGSVSALALIAGVWAQRAIGRDMAAGLRLEYVVLPAAYVWFWAVAIALLWLGWRQHRSERSPIV